MKKVIFLDIDGVFNCEEWYIEREKIKPEIEYPSCEFSPKRVKLFNKIIEATKADIVISSTWRHSGEDYCRDLFKSLGIKGNIIGVTPDFRGEQSCRGNEIKFWVDSVLVYPWKSNPEIQGEFEIRDEKGFFKKMRSQKENVDFTYCIIDDDSDMLLDQRKNFVQTHWKKGLGLSHVNKSIKILNNFKP